MLESTYLQRRSLLLNRNQSINLQRKLMDWFLYDRDFQHERVNTAALTRYVQFF